jgi:Zn-finger nucleic acid-binding protein
MVILEYKGVELDFCLSCRGCWLDWGELGVFLTGRSDPSEDWSLQAERAGRRRCPRCGRQMRVGKLADVSLEVDVCPDRHGVWLDGGELAQIIMARALPEHSSRAQAWLQEVLGGDTGILQHEGGAT